MVESRGDKRRSNYNSSNSSNSCNSCCNSNNSSNSSRNSCCNSSCSGNRSKTTITAMSVYRASARLRAARPRAVSRSTTDNKL